MKNLLVANYRAEGRVPEAELRRLVDAQVANSIEIGWAASDLVVVTNLALDLPVNVVRAPLNETCLKGSKMFALHYLLDRRLLTGSELWWAHDLDAWQNYWFDPPDVADIGLAEYSIRKFNGGSVFIRAAAHDLVAAIVARIAAANRLREEPAINAVLRSSDCKHRVTTLNSTYNVGCSGYAVRHRRSLKPILVSHFHPRDRRSWRTHVEGMNDLGEASVAPRLRELLVQHFYGANHPLQNCPKGLR